MKKNCIGAFIFMAFILVAAAALFTACDFPAAAPSAAPVTDEVVRIHIRANSNSRSDQAVKLAVRDALTAELESMLAGCRNKAEAVDILKKGAPNIAQIAQTTLEEHGFEYKPRVELRRERFPERDYDGYVFPEGDYDALIVELGTGKGDNWWCVAFPPLCFVPDSGSGEKIVYKSWVKELLDRIFG